MKKLFLALLILFATPAYSKVLELGDQDHTVINTSTVVAIQKADCGMTRKNENMCYTLLIRHTYTHSGYTYYYYNDYHDVDLMYAQLIKYMKQDSLDKCLQHGGGKACYKREG